MLKQSLKLKRNYLLIEYAFVDKGAKVIAVDAKDSNPLIIGKKIVSIGSEIDPLEYPIGEDIILNPNTTDYDSVNVFFTDNTFDRKLVAEKALKDIKLDSKHAFTDYLVLAYTCIPASCVVASFMNEKQVDYEAYGNSKTVILNVN